MNNKMIAGALITAAVFGGGAFWAGMAYAQGKVGGGRGQFVAAGGNFGGRAGGSVRFGGGGGNAFGTIVAKDPTSITLQITATTTGSGSKIILYNEATEVGKMVAASTNDLFVGESVSVSGTPNSDGSLNAQMIQIRPAGMQQPQGTR